MGAEQIIRLTCNGPFCTKRPMEWSVQEQQPEQRIVDAIYGGFTVQFADKTEVWFCGKKCGLEWLDRDFPKLKVKAPRIPAPEIPPNPISVSEVTGIEP